MKRKLHIGSSILVLALLCLLACRKTINSTEEIVPKPPVKTDSTKHQADSVKNQTDSIPAKTDTSTVVPFPETPLLGCTYSPDYGDSIVFTQPTNGQDYVIYPVNNGGIAGKYFAWPVGLVLNSQTGAIDMTKSETGARYAIGFVKEGTTDTCLSQLIVGGAAYMDSVYVLGDNQTTAAPYFNANPYAPAGLYRKFRWSGLPVRLQQSRKKPGCGNRQSYRDHRSAADHEKQPFRVASAQRHNHQYHRVLQAE